MAEKTKAAAPRAAQPKDEFRSYEDWFVATPDPWIEITKLEHGGDRTHASTVRAMILNAEPAQRPVMEKKLLEAIARPGVTEPGRMFVCKMLALIGSTAAVPVLAPLLDDPRSVDAARYALDVIEDPAVDDLYRAALAKLTGTAKAGLIGSIALRGDTRAAGALAAIKDNASEPAEVRAAATRAVERLTAKS